MFCLQIKEYKCTECSNEYCHKKDLLAHMSVRHGLGTTKNRECPICGKALSTANYAQHLDGHGKGLHCVVCGVLIKHKRNLSRHMKMHKTLNTSN